MFSSLQQLLKQAIAPIAGVMGVCIHDVASGRELGVRLDEPLPMASICKLPILVAAYREHDAGRLDLAERVTIARDHHCLGSGILNFFDVGLRPTIHDLLLLMIVVSDNAATDLVLERVPPRQVTSAMRELGLPSIQVDRTLRELLNNVFTTLDPRLEGLTTATWRDQVDGNPEMRAAAEDLNELRHAVNQATRDRDVATPRAIARLLAQIATDRCADAGSCQSMRDILNEQQLNARLPRDLPAFSKLPHKTGTFGAGAVVNDAGILMLHGDPVATIAVLSRDLRSPKYETEAALARVGRIVFDHYVMIRERNRQ